MKIKTILKAKVISWINREVWYHTKVGLVYNVIPTPDGYRATEFGDDDSPYIFYPIDVEITKEHHIDLNVLTKSLGKDYLSGRELGKSLAIEGNIALLAAAGDTFVIFIDDTCVKAINDSFIKGFFEGIFKILRTRNNVGATFKLEASDYYKRLFSKNWLILEALNSM